MRLSARPLVMIAVCGLAMLCTACGASNNKGKIEGKWKMVSGPGFDEQAKMFEMLKAYFYFDFKPEGTLALGLEMSDPEMKKMFEGKVGAEKTSFTCKYKLLKGDAIEIYDLPKEMQKEGGGGLFGRNKDKARTNVKINGDNMTMTDEDGKSFQLSRVK
jgi:hypothetical protein